MNNSSAASTKIMLVEIATSILEKYCCSLQQWQRLMHSAQVSNSKSCGMLSYYQNLGQITLEININMSIDTFLQSYDYTIPLINTEKTYLLYLELKVCVICNNKSPTMTDNGQILIRKSENSREPSDQVSYKLPVPTG